MSIGSALKLVALAVVASCVVAAPRSASAHGFAGHQHNNGFYATQTYQSGSSGYSPVQPGYAGGNCQPSVPQWHNTSHWDHTPGYYWQHGNHVHYQRPQLHWHESGHWHN